MRALRGSTRLLPYLLLASVWFLVSDFVPGPALLVAFGVSVVGLAIGIARYRRNPAGRLPNVMFVGLSLVVGSGMLLVVATVG